MSRLVFDLEGDELLWKVKNLWCMVTEDIDTGEVLTYPPDTLSEALCALSGHDVLIGHNIIGYDLSAIWKLYGGQWEHVPLIVDTLVVSRTLFPERPGGHSLAAWGERLGSPKIEFNEYDKYSEEMLTYCAQDVHLNVLVYHALNKELEEQHGEQLEGYKVY